MTVETQPLLFEGGGFNPLEAAPSDRPEAEDLRGLHPTAHLLLETLENDQETFEICDDYVQGKHADPYMPDSATEEYRKLAKRSVVNWVRLIVDTPAQALYVDNFRSSAGGDHGSAAWRHWQNSGLDARQSAVYRGAFHFGHAFVVTEREADGVVRSRGLSARKTAALFEDPANDLDPVVAITVLKQARWRKGTSGERIPGTAIMWDESERYTVRFDGTKIISIVSNGEHGNSSCPVTRFACAVDLEGRTVGIVEPIIPLQDRINQTVFDLLVAQTYGSFKVRTVTGMAPPMLMQAVYETDSNGDPIWYVGDTIVPEGTPNAQTKVIGQEVVRDPATGSPIPAPINLNASRWQFAASKDVKFDTLDETPLDGYIAAIDLGVKHLSAVTQTPPHFLLGEIANISAEALQAAELSLSRKVTMFQTIFGEAWERVFRLAAELEGDTETANDHASEVIWRDLDATSMSKTADALAKLKEIGVPIKALWEMVPKVTTTQLENWEEYAKDDDSIASLAEVLDRNTQPRQREESLNGATSTEPTG